MPPQADFKQYDREGGWPCSDKAAGVALADNKLNAKAMPARCILSIRRATLIGYVVGCLSGRSGLRRRNSADALPEPKMS